MSDNIEDSNANRGWTIAIHGGAGTIPGEMTLARETVYHTALRRALAAGTYVLAEGGSAVDAVEEAVRMLENEPIFNAGRGAVMTIDGTFELDASIMDGTNMKTGLSKDCLSPTSSCCCTPKPQPVRGCSNNSAACPAVPKQG